MKSDNWKLVLGFLICVIQMLAIMVAAQVAGVVTGYDSNLFLIVALAALAASKVSNVKKNAVSVSAPWQDAMLSKQPVAVRNAVLVMLFAVIGITRTLAHAFAPTESYVHSVVGMAAGLGLVCWVITVISRAAPAAHQST